MERNDSFITPTIAIMFDTDPPRPRSQSFSGLPSTFPCKPSYNDARSMKIQQGHPQAMETVTGRTKRTSLTSSYSRGASFVPRGNDGLISRRRSIPRRWTNEFINHIDIQSSSDGSSNPRCGGWGVLEFRNNTLRDEKSDDDENDDWLQSRPFPDHHPQKRVRLNRPRSLSRTSSSKAFTSSTLTVHPHGSVPTATTQVRDV